MTHRSLRLIAGVLTMTCWAIRIAQAAQPAEYFAVCGSQINQPTIYFSGVLQGPPAAFLGFQAGFNAFLVQHYAYKGLVACLPTNSAVNAQNFINSKSTALRNAKHNVIETGWTEAAAAAAPPVAPVLARAQNAAPAAAANSPAPGSATAAAGNTGGASQLSSILTSVFGGNGGGSSGSPAAGSKGGSPGGAGSGAASNSSGSGNQNTLAQVSNTLTSVFGNKSGGAAPAEAAPKSPQPGVPDGALGMAQTPMTKLVVYGCGRQDKQVACVTDLTNQNQKDTLVQAADAWKDAFIVDDRGDRHQRSNGFFLNVDGDQRPQLDISYGKSARFILLFDEVQTKVQKVALRSATGGLDVEEINLIDPNAAVQASHSH